MDTVNSHLRCLGITDNYYCRLCYITLISYLDVLNHVYSTKHRSNAVAYLRIQYTKEVNSLANLTLHNYCTICDDNIRFASLHINTSEHIVNAYVYIITTIVNATVESSPDIEKEFGYYRCNQCALNIEGVFNCFVHLKHDNHVVNRIEAGCDRELKWHMIQNDMSCTLCMKNNLLLKCARLHISSHEHKAACHWFLSRENVRCVNGDDYHCSVCFEQFGLLNALGHVATALHKSKCIELLLQMEQCRRLELTRPQEAAQREIEQRIADQMRDLMLEEGRQQIVRNSGQNRKNVICRAEVKKSKRTAAQERDLMLKEKIQQIVEISKESRQNPFYRAITAAQERDLMLEEKRQQIVEISKESRQNSISRSEVKQSKITAAQGKYLILEEKRQQIVEISEENRQSAIHQEEINKSIRIAAQVRDLMLDKRRQQVVEISEENRLNAIRQAEIQRSKSNYYYNIGLHVFIQTLKLLFPTGPFL